MQTTLTFGALTVLFGIMFVGALIPGLSVITVTARTVSSGFLHGVFTTAGIVLGDILFILIAIYGLAFLFEALGEHFRYLEYLGGAYLLFIAVTLMRTSVQPLAPESRLATSRLASFLAGLTITLSDQKAILFYLGFFPAFLDLASMTILDAGIIVAISILAVGGPKLGYALLAQRARVLFTKPQALQGLNLVAGVLIFAVGIYVLLRAGMAGG